MAAIKKKDRLTFEAVLSNQKADKKMCYARLYTGGGLLSNLARSLILRIEVNLKPFLENFLNFEK